MSLPLDSATAHQVAEAARAANTQALEHPAKMASYLDRNWHARAHSDLISQSLADLADGTVRRLLITTPPQIGKPVYIGSMILMGDGSRKPLADVQTGETVITHNGRPRRVTAVHEQGLKRCVRITTRSGRVTIAATDHPFLTPDGWIEAGDLEVGDGLASVPRPDTSHPGEISPNEARLMGYFVGDGTTAGLSGKDINGNTRSFAAAVTCFSDAAVKRMQEAANELGFTMTLRDSPSARGRRFYAFRDGVRPWLLKHGLARKNSYTKRVPEAVFRSSREVIAEFIAGYWDCDGVVSSRGKDRDGKPRRDVHCELYSVSRELLGDVQHLLLRLGIRASIRTKKGSYNDAEHISYRLQLIARDDVAKFRKMIDLAHEKRAAALQQHTMPRTDFDQSLMADAITEIEHIGNRECRCLTVEDDHTFTSDDLVVHNSTLVSEWFPFWWLARNPQHRVIVGSYGTSLANRRGRVVRRLVREHGWRYGLEMERGAASVAEWTLETGGGLKSVGVGSAVTGSPADCVAAGTLITTENGLIPAARLARMPNPPRVAAYSHPRQRFEWQPLLAVRALKAPALRELHTYGGRSLWCTPDHPVYILGKGYVPAARVKRGMELVAGTDMPGALEPRGFPLPTPDPERAVGESTRPATAPPVHHRRTETPLPARVPDWVTSNTPVRNQRSGEWRTVYDFQVRDCQNFLADGILAHNCAIVDDPHKNRAEAESLVTRDKVWDWWSADITSRLAPGAPIVLVLTLWHIDDLAARVIEQDGREEHGGMWRVIRMPALADREDDPLARDWGEPLPHPKIPEQDHDTARQHWDMKRSTSLVRDWHALYQCDPKPNEGALVSPELLRARRHIPPPAGVQRYGVAIDPAAGGRDLAGVIGGYLGNDSRLYVTHDSSRNGHSEQWGMEAALLAAEHDAEFVIFEKSGLFDQSVARTAFDSAWSAVERLQDGRAGEFDEDEHVRRAQQLSTLPAKPQLKFVVARKGKLLRAEPIAQQWFDDRMRTGAYLPHLEAEWTTHQVTDPESPGRIDASVYLAYEMLPIPGAEAMISVVSQLSRDQVQWEAQRRQSNASAAQPQMGARIQRAPIRPGQ